MYHHGTLSSVLLQDEDQDGDVEGSGRLVVWRPRALLRRWDPTGVKVCKARAAVTTDPNSTSERSDIAI